MKHQICVESRSFVQAIKNAAIYASKEDNNLNHVLLAVVPKLKKLSVLGCDGLGYYENRIPLAYCKNKPKPTLPGKEMRLCISLADIAMLGKFIPSRTIGQIRIELDDTEIADNKFIVKLVLPDGKSTSFYAPAQIELPDLSIIRARAEKGKKKNPVIQALQIPLRELSRIAKVLPSQTEFAQIFTSAGISKGIMALLECKNDETDVSVIFMLNQPVTA